MKSIKLVKFDLNEFMSMNSGDEAVISAIIDINGKQDTLSTLFSGAKQEFMPGWKTIKGVPFKLGLSSLIFEDNMSEPKAEISFLQERLIVEVSRKPLINLVWLGTILMVGGFMWAYFKRRK
jgi:hypothetical protein